MTLPVIPNTVRNLTWKRKEIHRFALNDKGSALNDPPCHSEHREESHSEKEKKEIHR